MKKLRLGFMPSNKDRVVTELEALAKKLIKERQARKVELLGFEQGVVKEEERKRHQVRIEFKCDPQEVREVDNDHSQN